MHKTFILFLKDHPSMTFAVMFLAALLFGLSSYNLFSLLHQNLRLILENGWMALMDGAFLQFCELLGSGIMALLSYVVFKIGEKILVEHYTK